jgi:hypothetical protein
LSQDWEIIEFGKHSLAMAVIGNPKPILTPSPELPIRNYTKFDAIFVKFHKRLQSAEFILVLVVVLVP